MDGRWLSILEFAHYKGKSVSTVRRYIKADRVKHKEENGKYFIWAKDYHDPAQQNEKAFLELRLENERLKKENRVLSEQTDELKMLVEIYEEESLASSRKGSETRSRDLPALPIDLDY
ncbi:MAG: hypothetical protein WD025_04505 [Bacteriovoracaceae bacterium]